ncbi:MAG: hypothetical protein R2741_05730 [Methanolobus sp.]
MKYHLSSDWQSSMGVTTVPAIVISRNIVINYEDYHGDIVLLESMLSEAIVTAPPVPPDTIVSSDSTEFLASDEKQNPAFIFVAGLLAGFNPCLVAVMAFLASVVVSSAVPAGICLCWWLAFAPEYL